MSAASVAEQWLLLLLPSYRFSCFFITFSFCAFACAIVCVCVCAHTRLHPHIYTLRCVDIIERCDRRHTFILYNVLKHHHCYIVESSDYDSNNVYNVVFNSCVCLFPLSLSGSVSFARSAARAQPNVRFSNRFWLVG